MFVCVYLYVCGYACAFVCMCVSVRVCARERARVCVHLNGHALRFVKGCVGLLLGPSARHVQVFDGKDCVAVPL